MADTCSSTTQPLDGQSHQSHGESISQSVSQSVRQSASKSAKQSLTTTIIQSHAPRNATSLYVSLTPTRTVCHSAGNPFNLTQLIMSLRIHSLTQHVTRTQFSGLLSLMPLSLAWLHPLYTHSCYPLIMCDVPSGPVLSYDCYLTPLPISHALTLTLSTCSHAKAKCLLSFSPSHTCRCLRRTEVEDHDL